MGRSTSSIVKVAANPLVAAQSSIGRVALPNAFNGQLANTVGLGQYRPEAYNIDRSAFDPDQQEKDFVKVLQERVAGRAPSVAETQLIAGQDAANRNALALAASQRGISPGMAARLASRQQGEMQSQAGQQAAALRAQEQQAAEQSLGSALLSQRQGRMAREQLGVSQQTGINAAGASGFEGSQQRRGQFLQNIGQGLATKAFGMYEGGVVGYANGGIAGFDQSFESKNNEIQKEGSGQLQMPRGFDAQAQEAMQKTGASLGSYLLKKQGTGGAGVSSISNAPMAKAVPSAFASGGKVPGKAVIDGDSAKNDFVPALLSPGELVVPRSVVAEGPEAISEFAKALLSRKA